ncbi:hypothetical protein [Zymomonas mobilis]|uniref:hypothetical protein n=1 Tax=Zymomonas mobilis TaxID=542 RepID=UPI0005C53C6F|nr:hypothetical protein [Zymomonas mobilis]
MLLIPSAVALMSLLCGLATAVPRLLRAQAAQYAKILWQFGGDFHRPDLAGPRRASITAVLRHPRH